MSIADHIRGKSLHNEVGGCVNVPPAFYGILFLVEINSIRFIREHRAKQISLLRIESRERIKGKTKRKHLFIIDRVLKIWLI